MKKTLVLTALAALIALPMLAAPTDADASCRSRKVNGTILGGVGGALVGREIGKSGCNKSRAYYAPRHGNSSARAQAATPVRKVYYDRYGNVVASEPAYVRR